jgi:2-haloacid dehalogenase
MIDPDDLDLLSFDCYGTLINWEAGILSTLKVVLAAHGQFPGPPEVLEEYGRLETAAEAGPYTEYRNVLREVMKGFGVRYNFLPTDGEVDALVKSLPQWRPFEDTVAALTRLKTRYRLAILSNTDDDLFAHTARRLEVSFDLVVTAQQVGAYKPSPSMFAALISRAAMPVDRILHVAQSLYHDVAPAQSHGLATVWVRRVSQRERFGATPPSDARADLEVTDLSSLAEALGV